MAKLERSSEHAFEKIKIKIKFNKIFKNNLIQIIQKSISKYFHCSQE
jgi:hypothetical protein